MSRHTTREAEAQAAARKAAAHDRMVAAYFIGAWRKGERFMVARLDEHLILCDGLAAVRVGNQHPAVESRRVAPQLPDDGAGFAYIRGVEPKPHTALLQLWERTAGEATLPLSASAWCYQGAQDVICRAFLLESGRPILVNKRLADLVATNTHDLQTVYEWRTVRREGGPVAGFAKQLDGSPLVAILMPMGVYRMEPMPQAEPEREMVTA